MAPVGNPTGPAQMVEHTMNFPYMHAKLVDLGKQFWQRAVEALAVWLLCLWDLGVDSIMCTVMREKLASIMTHTSLRQQLQNSW